MKKITIHQLLNWAFTQELPKVGAGTGMGSGMALSSWEVFSDMITLGTIVDRSPNGFGVVPGYIDMGEPHADALIVGQHVNGLADCGGFEIAPGWNPFPEWADEYGLIADEVARVVATELGRGGRLNGKQIVNMVKTYAVLRTRPDWSAEEPAAVMLKRYGQPAWFVQRRKRNRLGVMQDYEDDGFDPKTGRPRKGAYRKFKLDRSIRADIMSRLEWQLWQSALEALAHSLNGALSAHEILPFLPNRRPWANVDRA